MDFVKKCEKHNRFESDEQCNTDYS